MHASQAAYDLIKSSESLWLKAYRCPAGKLTIGYGHTRGVKEGDEITEHDAERLLADDVDLAEQCLQRNVKVALTQGQVDALVDWIFNLGCGNFMNSTLLRCLNAGNYQGAHYEIGRWVHSRGQKLNGLVTRRKAEQELFDT